MSHIALYRKYRPETFDTVVGQDAVIASLKASLVNEKISHAYLFSGSRGTGKTSIARIFARELGVSPNDIYEIDAASHNGVEEIRELRDGVATLPFDSKYKVYILDEVHMLSKAAFNALLKTLEEPPAHVIFILATTELHKVLDTIISRCQVFEFKKPGIAELSQFVQSGAKKEGRAIEQDAADFIARAADGAYRDAWGIVERVLQASSDKTIALETVADLIGVPHQEQVYACVDAMVQNSLDDVLVMIRKADEQGDLNVFVQDILETCRLVLLKRFSPKLFDALTETLAEERKQQIERWASEKNVINAQLLVELLGVLDDMKKTSMPVIVLELAVMKLLSPEN